MQPILTAAEMRALEQEAFAGGAATSLQLQERAAAGALALLPPEGPLEVLAGPGNNGGDALALARMAREQGRAVRVWTLAPEPRWKGDAAVQADRWQALGGTYAWTEAPGRVTEAWEGRWIVDGLFGLGASRPLEGLARAWVEAISDHPVLALDQPSGWPPDAHQEGIGRASVTACFGAPKLIHLLEPGRRACGRIEVVDLGLDVGAAVHHRLDRPFLPRVAWDAHKRTRGHVAIRAGSMGMSGAAVLAALGALRVGAGLVTLLPDPEVRAEVASQVPEAMVHSWERRIPEGVDVLLVGPGGIEAVPAWPGPLVLDASALRPQEGPRWMARPDTILTPHGGEFARLFGLPRPSSAGERLAQARAAGQGPGVLLLKGPQSLVVGGGSPEVWINDTGHWGLATGGTGDLLAGMVAGLRPLAGPPPAATASAAWLHGTCADRLGRGPLMVRDLVAELPHLLRECHA